MDGSTRLTDGEHIPPLVENLRKKQRLSARRGEEQIPGPTTPTAWDNTITSILGASFPYFASVGNHDVSAWSGYQQKLATRLALVPDATCVGTWV